MKFSHILEGIGLNFSLGASSEISISAHCSYMSTVDFIGSISPKLAHPSEFLMVMGLLSIIHKKMILNALLSYKLAAFSKPNLYLCYLGINDSLA